MSNLRNLIKSAVLDFQAHKNACSGKWLSLQAWHTILYKYYGFGEGLDFTIEDLTKAFKFIGPVTSDVCQLQ